MFFLQIYEYIFYYDIYFVYNNLKRKITMNITFNKFVLCMFVITSCGFYGCERDNNSDFTEASALKNLLTRSSYSDTIDWENRSTFDMVDAQSHLIKNVNFPWVPGTSNMGIPSDWIDPHVNDDISQRIYTKLNHWVLLYTNVHQTSNAKYIVMYNIYTGIMRCFFYTNGSSSDEGSTNSMWGVGLNVPSSIFNFTGSYAAGIADSKDYPIFLSTQNGSFSDNKYLPSAGYQNNTWYGFQVECSYDSNLSSKSNAQFTFLGRALDSITYKGNSTTTGNINGSITTVGNSNGNINLNFSNMFNNSSTISVTQNSTINMVGGKIDSEISKGNPFFSSLWTSIKNNAAKTITSGLEQGAKKGLEAIVSQGGSIAASALGKLFGSFMGGNTPTVSTVDLGVKMQSSFSFSSIQSRVGWGNVSAIPVPGLSSYVSVDKPLYNEPLGVWNLSETPIVTLHVSATDYYQGKSRPGFYYKTSYIFDYSLDSYSPIVLNPVIAKDFNIENANYEIVASSIPSALGSITQYEPCAFFNNKYYYFIGTKTRTSGTIVDGGGQGQYYSASTDNGSKDLDVLVRVSFDLVNTKTNEKIYISKYFYPNRINTVNGVHKIFVNGPEPID